MTATSQRLTYSRELLLKFKHAQKIDPTIRAVFKYAPLSNMATTKYQGGVRQVDTWRSGNLLTANSTGKKCRGEASPGAVDVTLTKPSAEATTQRWKSKENAPTSTMKFVNASPDSLASPQTPRTIDIHQLEQRQKQIDYGHQTLGYIRYRLLVPKERRGRDDPRTPKKSQTCSKRSWEGQIKKWRRELHKWDPEDSSEFMAWLDSDFGRLIIQNNIGTEVMDLLAKVKERAAIFGNTLTPPSPPSPNPVARVTAHAPGFLAEGDEKIARKLVF